MAASIVITPVAGSIRRRRLLRVSATSSAPSAAIPSPCGPATCAAVAGPPSPPPPSTPVPATATGVPEPPARRNTCVSDAKCTSAPGPAVSGPMPSPEFATVVGVAPSRRSSAFPAETRIAPDGVRATAYGRGRPDATTPTAAAAGSTRRTRLNALSTTSSVPDGSSSIDVGSERTRGAVGAALTVIGPRRDVEPPAWAVSSQRPAFGNTRRARYEPRAPVTRVATRPGPEAVTRRLPRNDAGRTASLAFHCFPTVAPASGRTSETCTGAAADAPQAATTPTAAAQAASVVLRRATIEGCDDAYD